jgi:hypothetical protein
MAPLWPLAAAFSNKFFAARDTGPPRPLIIISALGL